MHQIERALTKKHGLYRPVKTHVSVYCTADRVTMRTLQLWPCEPPPFAPLDVGFVQFSAIEARSAELLHTYSREADVGTHCNSFGVDAVFDELNASFELVLVQSCVEKLREVLQHCRRARVIST